MLSSSSSTPSRTGTDAPGGRSKSSTTVAFDQLADAGILLPLSESKRNRAWEASGLLDILADLEAAK